MSRKIHHSVLVAGAGPAGLSAALFLHERGVDVEVVDPGEMPSDDELAVVIHRDVVERLADAGITFDVDTEARRIETLAIHDRERRRAEVELFGRAPSRGSPIVVPRWLVCQKLDALLRKRGVKVGWNHRLARVDIDAVTGHVAADIDALGLDGAGYAFAVTEKLVVRSARHEPGFLVAADGDSSIIRQQLGLGVRAIAPPEVTASFELDTEHDAGREARIIVGEAMTSIWPLPKHGLRISFHLGGDALPGGRSLDRDDLIALLRTHAPDLRLRVGALRRTRLEFRVPAIADRPNLGAAWLLGDAARALPAAGSAPLNQGIRDAHALAASIAQALRAGGIEPLGDYPSRVRAAAMNGIRLGEQYQPVRGADAFLAEHGRRILPLVPARGPDLDEIAHRLGLAPAR